jgi:DUF438 domain-containing protein
MGGKTWDEWLVGEHEMIERAMDVLRKQLEKVADNSQDRVGMGRAIDFLLEFGDRIHNQKEEEILFPLMVKRGIPQDGPIRVMLSEHDAERTLLHQMTAEAPGLRRISADDRAAFKQRGLEYLDIRANHIWKENDVLFKMGLQVLSVDDGKYLMEEFGRINNVHYGKNAEQQFLQMLEEVEKAAGERKSLIRNLSYEQIDAIMETLPLEVTFVDASDTVAYFNRLDKEKIFVRSRSVIGRKVEKCHPQKSVHLVKEIVAGFKSGRLDKAEFWIDFKGDKIYIRYFPVRNETGDYMGVLEVTQAIGAMQKLTGEKRLLD